MIKRATSLFFKPSSMSTEYLFISSPPSFPLKNPAYPTYASMHIETPKYAFEMHKNMQNIQQTALCSFIYNSKLM